MVLVRLQDVQRLRKSGQVLSICLQCRVAQIVLVVSEQLIKLFSSIDSVHTKILGPSRGEGEEHIDQAMIFELESRLLFNQDFPNFLVQRLILLSTEALQHVHDFVVVAFADLFLNGGHQGRVESAGRVLGFQLGLGPLQLRELGRRVQVKHLEAAVLESPPDLLVVMFGFEGQVEGEIA